MIAHALMLRKISIKKRLLLYCFVLLDAMICGGHIKVLDPCWIGLVMPQARKAMHHHFWICSANVMHFE